MTRSPHSLRSTSSAQRGLLCSSLDPASVGASFRPIMTGGGATRAHHLVTSARSDVHLRHCPGLHRSPDGEARPLRPRPIAINGLRAHPPSPSGTALGRRAPRSSSPSAASPLPHQLPAPFRPSWGPLAYLALNPAAADLLDLGGSLTSAGLTMKKKVTTFWIRSQGCRCYNILTTLLSVQPWSSGSLIPQAPQPPSPAPRDPVSQEPLASLSPREASPFPPVPLGSKPASGHTAPLPSTSCARNH